MRTGVIIEDTLANRPPAGRKGRFFHATDTGEVHLDTGSVWTAMGSGGGGGASPAEQAVYADRAALLDPNCLTFYETDGDPPIDFTVPAGETWYLLEAWHLWSSASGPASGDGAYWFHRRPTVAEAVALPGGTRVFSLDPSVAVQAAHALVAKPAAVKAGDTRYTDDPKGLYYERLNRLATELARHHAQVSINGGLALGTLAYSAFDADFTRGLVVAASSHDLAWLTLADGNPGTRAMNLWDEVSDDHQWREGGGQVVPFLRATFPGILARNASAAGTTGSGLNGRGHAMYVKLPANW